MGVGTLRHTSNTPSTLNRFFSKLPLLGQPIVCLFFFHHSSRLVQRAFGVSLERKESFPAVFEIWLPRQSFLCLQEVKAFHPIHELPLIKSKGVAGWSHCNSS